MLRRTVRDPRNLPFALALICALLVAPELPSPASRPGRLWQGWYILLYRDAAAPAVEAALSAYGPESASRARATVRIDAFSEIETLPVAAIDDRLDPLDPRRDPWLDGVSGYFAAEDDGAAFLAAYVPATRGRIATWFRLSRALRAAGAPVGSWQLADAGLPVLLAGPAAALGFALFLARLLRRDGRRSLLRAAAGALAWLPALLNGGPADLCLCCAALYLWIPGVAGRARQPDHRLDAHAVRTGMRIGVPLALAVVIIAVDGAGLYRAWRISASLACLELLAGLATPFPRLRSPRRRVGHRFQPVPILAPRVPAFAPLAAGLAALLFAMAPAALSRLRAPLPRTVSLAAAGSRAGIEAAARAGDTARLPGLAEAVGHAALLQTAAFGPGVDGPAPPGTATDSLPPREGRVRLREYGRGSGAGSLVEAPRTVARFDPGWLGRLVAGFRPGSVERLLLDQRRPVEVRVRAPWTSLLRAIPEAMVLLALLGAPLIGPPARRHLMHLGLWGITEPARSRRTR
jgi:hypothetical protein